MLERFLGAADLHLKGEYSSITVEGSKDGPTPFEIWQKDQLIRIDYYRNGALYRTLIVKDGAATFYFYGSGNKVPSVMPAMYYTDLMRQHIGTLSGSEMASDGKSAAFTFTVDRFYKNENAQAGYYVTAVRYIVGPNGILSQTVYGKDSYGSKPAAVNQVTQEFSLVEINSGIESTIFNPPF